MNDENIERLLRKAPPPTVPPGLLEQLQGAISLPRAQPDPVRRNSPRPWFKRWMPAASFAAFMLACLVLIAMQSDSISKLRQENHGLAEEARDLETLRQQSDELQKLRLENQELEKLRKDFRELESLRAEVNRLREEFASLPALHAENQKRRAELAAVRPGDGSAGGEEIFEKARAKAQSIVCVNNLKQIGLAARIFSGDHQEVLPPDFATMANELVTPKILTCPGDLGKIEAANWFDFGPGNTSYEMLSPGLKGSAADASVVFARCLIHGHVCLADGSVHQNPEQQGLKVILKEGKHVLVRPTLRPAPDSFE